LREIRESVTGRTTYPICSKFAICSFWVLADLSLDGK
jgi:hypothetical protein